MKDEIKRIIIVLVLFCMAFTTLIVYLSAFQIFKAEEIKSNLHNKRLWLNEENVLRGRIVDRNDLVLVESLKEDKDNKRNYKYGRMYSHLIGYSYKEYGKAGLELYFNNELLDIKNSSIFKGIKDLVLPKSVGNNLKLTIDHGLQEKSHELLGGKKGAIVVINPKTGEIYSMVSMPDFNVTKLNEDWKNLIEDKNSPLINRATQGLYPPGSIFKIITSSAALSDLNLPLDYVCKGSVNIDGYTINDYGKKAHGKIGLEEAFAKSCNTYFAEKSLIIGKNSIGQYAERFMINKDINFDIAYKNSKFIYKTSLGDTDIASSSIGQGKVLVTPLNMALVASAIANEGRMMRPILVKEVINSKGQILKEYNSELLSQSVNHIIANKIKEMMVDSVRDGSASRAKIKNTSVAGKTGTAQNSTGRDHGWFIGFAPSDDPKLALVVIIEEAGDTGGQVAAPIGRELLIYGLDNIND